MSSRGKRIFIVEDQRLIAADLAATLERIGYQIAGSVASGEEAIEQAPGARPDLILMDIRLRGELDGIQAAAAIRSLLDVPIVYLTAYADEETVMRAQATSPFGYIVKPFNEREVRAAIEIAIYRHHTEHRLAEEQARRHQAEEFKLLVDCVEDYAIVMLDPNGRVRTWNEGARRLTGYAAAEILGKDVSMFHAAEDVEAGHVARLLDVARRDGRAELEGWRLRRDGSRFWASVIMSAVRGADGDLVGLGEVTRDRTERRDAELQLRALNQELQAAIRVRDEFLSIAAHELRTPLSALVLQLDGLDVALAAGDGRTDKLHDKVAKAIRSSRRLTSLVDSLLDVSRIETGHLHLNLERVDLAELVRDVTDRLAEEARRAGSLLHVHAPASVTGCCDRVRLEQVVLNLLYNAIRYGAGQPIDVDVDVDSQDGVARVSIRDRGIGISEPDLDRIFGRFERAVASRHYGGLGLGLYIANQIVEAHRGRLRVHSQLGSGSTFTIEIPDAGPGWGVS